VPPVTRSVTENGSNGCFGGETAREGERGRRCFGPSATAVSGAKSQRNGTATSRARHSARRGHPAVALPDLGPARAVVPDLGDAAPRLRTRVRLLATTKQGISLAAGDFAPVDPQRAGRAAIQAIALFHHSAHVDEWGEPRLEERL
jgi:hypothetical protein